MKITNKQFELARKNWVEASIKLNFKIVTPYFIEINGRKKEVFAFLPEYGSPNGTIMYLTCATEFETNSEIVNWAKKNKYFYSFINIETLQKYDENYFKEILDDWIKM